MRAGLYRPVHVKTLRSQKLRMLLTHRRLLQSKAIVSVLAEAGLPAICVETRQMRAALKARINKTDRNDARGIAQMIMLGKLN
jgi:transposase